MTDRKQVRSVRLKDEDEGKVRAVVATTGTVDADGDIIETGAFGRQDVVVSGFGHTSWQGAPPVGRGTVMESGDKAVGDLEFFLDTQHGGDLFRTVKRLGELGEWSFGFDVTGQRDPTPQEREDGAVRVLTDLEVHEVSPVLRGAGVGTGTLAAKCDRCAAADTVDPAAVREALKAGRRTLRRLEGKLEDANTFKRNPNGDAQPLAEFAASVGYALVGYPALPFTKGAPRVRWFLPRNGRTAFMRPSEHAIYVSIKRQGRPLVRSVLHEVKHHAQKDPAAPGMEDDADSFAKRWAPAVAAAYRATSGDSYRVHVKRGRPPFYGDRIRSGDVVLNRSDGRAYSYHPRHRSAAWKELAA